MTAKLHKCLDCDTQIWPKAKRCSKCYIIYAKSSGVRKHIAIVSQATLDRKERNKRLQDKKYFFEGNLSNAIYYLNSTQKDVPSANQRTLLRRVEKERKKKSKLRELYE